MATTTLQSPRFAPATRPNVAEALHALGVSARQLAVALWNTAFQRTAVVAEVPPALAEVTNLRSLADDVLATDPNFAQDLYAMADRLEREALAAHIA